MKEEQLDHACDLNSKLLKAVKELVNNHFKANPESEELEEWVRQKMTEDIRFWKDW